MDRPPPSRTSNYQDRMVSHTTKRDRFRDYRLPKKVCVAPDYAGKTKSATFMVRAYGWVHFMHTILVVPANNFGLDFTVCMLLPSPPTTRALPHTNTQPIRNHSPPPGRQAFVSLWYNNSIHTYLCRPVWGATPENNEVLRCDQTTRTVWWCSSLLKRWLIF